MRRRNPQPTSPAAIREWNGGIVNAEHRVRRFALAREHDVSGVSGTGIVAEGVCFTDGTCVVHWYGERRSTVVWSSIEDVEAIHGHGGASRILWLDA